MNFPNLKRKSSFRNVFAIDLARIYRRGLYELPGLSSLDNEVVSVDNIPNVRGVDACC